MPENICKNCPDALNYWLKNAKGAEAEQGVWAMSLDARRRFIGCDEIAWRFYAQPVLLADEALNAAKKRGAEEFILLHNRPSFAPDSLLCHSKARARAILLAARLTNCSLLDYILRGEKSDKYPAGAFSLQHLRSFHADDPFPSRSPKIRKEQTP